VSVGAIFPREAGFPVGSLGRARGATTEHAEYWQNPRDGDRFRAGQEITSMGRVMIALPPNVIVVHTDPCGECP